VRDIARDRAAVARQRAPPVAKGCVHIRATGSRHQGPAAAAPDLWART
jgi:hypothetical protein